LCLSWCQYLDIETFLFFLNGIFLNVTTGTHINVSQFKNLDEIEVLSIEFFNLLLHKRNANEFKVGESYTQWYARMFGRNDEVSRLVEYDLQNAFQERGGDPRIIDLWIEMPA